MFLVSKVEKRKSLKIHRITLVLASPVCFVVSIWAVLRLSNVNYLGRAIS